MQWHFIGHFSCETYQQKFGGSFQVPSCFASTKLTCSIHICKAAATSQASNVSWHIQIIVSKFMLALS